MKFKRVFALAVSAAAAISSLMTVCSADSLAPQTQQLLSGTVLAAASSQTADDDSDKAAQTDEISGKTSPDTGIEGIAGITGLALIAVGAVIITRNKKQQ